MPDANGYATKAELEAAVKRCENDHEPFPDCTPDSTPAGLLKAVRYMVANHTPPKHPLEYENDHGHS